jgi:hypothetical protein
MNLDLIKIKKIGNEFYGTFRWNDFDTGRFCYDTQRLTWSDIGFLI